MCANYKWKKWIVLKLKLKLYSSNYMIKRVKLRRRKFLYTYVTHIRISKELLNSNKKNSDNPKEKWAKIWTGNYKRISKQTMKGFQILVIMECKLKSQCAVITSQMKKQVVANVDKEMERPNFQTSQVGVQIATIVLENHWIISTKGEYKGTHEAGIPVLGISTQEKHV